MCLPWSDHPWWWALRQLPTLDDPFSRPLCDPLWIKTKHWVRLYDVTYMSMSLRFGFELNLWKSWLINKLFISCGLVHYILKTLKSKPHGMCKFQNSNLLLYRIHVTYTISSGLLSFGYLEELQEVKISIAQLNMVSQIWKKLRYCVSSCSCRGNYSFWEM